MIWGLKNWRRRGESKWEQQLLWLEDRGTAWFTSKIFFLVLLKMWPQFDSNVSKSRPFMLKTEEFTLPWQEATVQSFLAQNTYSTHWLCRYNNCLQLHEAFFFFCRSTCWNTSEKKYQNKPAGEISEKTSSEVKYVYKSSIVCRSSR